MKLPPTYTSVGKKTPQSFMCNSCGAVVVDQTKHKDFHARIEPPTSSEPFATMGGPGRSPRPCASTPCDDRSLHQ